MNGLIKALITNTSSSVVDSKQYISNISIIGSENNLLTLSWEEYLGALGSSTIVGTLASLLIWGIFLINDQWRVVRFPLSALISKDKILSDVDNFSGNAPLLRHMILQ